MVTARKTEPETEEPVSSSLSLSDVREAIADALGNLFDSGRAEVVDTAEDTPKKDEPKRRRTFREDEDEMEGIISKKVKELLAKEKAAGEDHEDKGPMPKAEPEEPPEKPKRRSESLMGWKW